MFNQIKFLFDKMPPYVIFYVTGRCNARCSHCFYWRNNTNETKELTLNEIEKISRGFGNIKYLSITGGEPTLREDVVDIIKIFYKNNNVQLLAFHTNGSMPEKIKNICEDICSNCPDMNFIVSLSLDNLEEKHDEIRGVKGLFKKVMKTVGEIKELQKEYDNLKMNIATVYSSYNKDDIKAIHKFVEDLGIDHSLPLVRGDTRIRESKDIDIDDYERVSNIVKNKDGNLVAGYPLSSFKLVLDNLTPEIVVETVKGQKQVLPCKAGRNAIVISENGTVYPCEMLDGKSFGNLREEDYDIKKILFSKRADEIREFIDRTKCFCTWECIVPINLMFNWRWYPKMFRRWLEKRWAV